MDTDKKGARKKKADNTPEQPKSGARVKGGSGREQSSRETDSAPDRRARSSDYQRPAKTLYWVQFFNEWCKCCGICVALCPQNIIDLNDAGYPSVEDMDECTGCRNCEIHCPDFAITVKKRHPERRKSDGAR
jgi:2-oxoglutarate ferredoxin oxidoreductase subunit delta